MPTSGRYYYVFYGADLKLWKKCRTQATAQMVAEGWKAYANKFTRVMQKRAMKLWDVERTTK